MEFNSALVKLTCFVLDCLEYAKPRGVIFDAHDVFVLLVRASRDLMIIHLVDLQIQISLSSREHTLLQTCTRSNMARSSMNFSGASAAFFPLVLRTHVEQHAMKAVTQLRVTNSYSFWICSRTLNEVNPL